MSWRSAVLELSNQLLKLRMYSIKTKVLDSEENSQTEILNKLLIMANFDHLYILWHSFIPYIQINFSV